VVFEVISSGSDEVEGITEGPGIEIDYINPSNQLVFIGDSINGTSFLLATSAIASKSGISPLGFPRVSK
jgi:hypothetical protein